MSYRQAILRRYVEACALLMGSTSLVTASLVAGSAYAGEQSQEDPGHTHSLVGTESWNRGNSSAGSSDEGLPDHAQSLDGQDPGGGVPDDVTPGAPVAGPSAEEMDAMAALERAPTSGMPTRVAVGEPGDDGTSGSKLGSLVTAGGVVIFVGGLIASRRRKASKK
jgi:hypothetical protein